MLSLHRSMHRRLFLLGAAMSALLAPAASRAAPQSTYSHDKLHALWPLVVRTAREATLRGETDIGRAVQHAVEQEWGALPLTFLRRGAAPVVVSGFKTATNTHPFATEQGEGERVQGARAIVTIGWPESRRLDFVPPTSLIRIRADGGYEDPRTGAQLTPATSA